PHPLEPLAKALFDLPYPRAPQHLAADVVSQALVPGLETTAADVEQVLAHLIDPVAAVLQGQPVALRVQEAGQLLVAQRFARHAQKLQQADLLPALGAGPARALALADLVVDLVEDGLVRTGQVGGADARRPTFRAGSRHLAGDEVHGG